MSENTAHDPSLVTIPRIVPVVIPHGYCGAWCPFCPPEDHDGETAALMPEPGDVARAMLRYAPTNDDDHETLLALYGGSLGALPHAIRAPLLDAAEREFRSGRIDGIRVTCDITRLLRAPLGEWRARGVRSIEIPLLSMAPRVLRELGCEEYPGQARQLVRKLIALDLEVGLQLIPGLPGDSHAGAVGTARLVREMAPAYVRILPALVLEGTRLETWWRTRGWDPMSLEQAVETSAAMLQVFREAGIVTARVGLQPEADLVRGPQVLDGPYHPALRHLVESRSFRKMIFEMARFKAFESRLVLRFNPKDESYVRGPMNGTLRELDRRFRIRHIDLVPDPELPRGRPVLES